MSERTFRCLREDCNTELQTIGDENFVLCFKCEAVNCTSCKAVHQGIDCKTYKDLIKKKNERQRKQELTTAKDSVKNELQEVKCKNEGCGAIGFVKAGSRFSPCNKCSTVTCLNCNEVHEGKPCRLKPVANPVEPLQTVKQHGSDEREKIVCKNKACGKINSVEEGSRLVRCSECSTVTCVKCNEAHEGRSCKLNTTEKHGESLQTMKDSVKNELQEVKCKNVDCGAIGFVKAGSRFSPCIVCRTVTCLNCNDVHEGKPCRLKPVANPVEPLQTVKQLGSDEREKACKANTAEKHGETLQTTKDCEIDKLEEVKCQKDGCGAINFIKTGSKLFPCSQCRTVTCLRCKEAHEGRSCKSKTAVNQTKPSQNAGLSPKGSNLHKPWVQDAKYPGKAVPLRSADSVDDNKQEEEPMEANPAQGNAEELLEAECPHCHAILFTKREQHTVSCEYCQRQFCSECRVNHEGKSCDDYMNKLQREAALQGIRQNGTSFSDENGNFGRKLTETYPRKVQCKNPSCGFAFLQKQPSRIFECHECGQATCLKCLIVHEGTSCKNYPDRIHEEGQASGLSVYKSEVLQLTCPNCKSNCEVTRSTERVKCGFCKAEFCRECCVAHDGRTCEEHIKSLDKTLNGQNEEVQKFSAYVVIGQKCPFCPGSMIELFEDEKARCEKCATEFCLKCTLFHEDESCSKRRLPIFNWPVQEIPIDERSSKKKYRLILCPFCNTETSLLNVEDSRMQCKDCKIKFCPRCRHKHKGQSCEEFFHGLQEIPGQTPYPGEPEHRNIICPACNWRNSVHTSNLEMKCFRCQREYCKFCLVNHGGNLCVRQKYFTQTQFSVHCCKPCETANFVPSTVFYWRCYKCALKTCIKDHSLHNKHDCANCQAGSVQSSTQG